jgi:hypothetical protein
VRKNPTIPPRLRRCGTGLGWRGEPTQPGQSRGIEPLDAAALTCVEHQGRPWRAIDPGQFTDLVRREIGSQGAAILSQNKQILEPRARR